MSARSRGCAGRGRSRVRSCGGILKSATISFARASSAKTSTRAGRRRGSPISPRRGLDAQRLSHRGRGAGSESGGRAHSHHHGDPTAMDHLGMSANVASEILPPLVAATEADAWAYVRATCSVTTWGESHGRIARVIDGCPTLLPLSEADIHLTSTARARPSALVTSARADTVRILSGVFEGKNLGTPVSLASTMGHAARRLPRGAAEVPAEPATTPTRPSTGSRLRAAAAPARARRGPLAPARRAQAPGPAPWRRDVAWVAKVGAILVECDVDAVTRAQVDTRHPRCPEPDTAARMIAAVEAARKTAIPSAAS